MKIRNIAVLSLSQVFAMAGPSLVVLVAGIVGAELAPSAILATLPITMMVIGVALFTIPAAMVMKKFGRRRGFMGAAIMAAGAALVAAYAVKTGSFALFCGALVFVGGNGAFVQQYRFAAAESTPPELVGRAVSFVLLGGILAGYLGPEIGKRTANWLDLGGYSGSFLALAGLYILAFACLSFFQNVSLKEEATRATPRPFRELLAQPQYPIAILAGVVAYGVMSFIMTATPISMHKMDGFSLDSTALVIQSHVMAMYLPSLVSGFLIGRFGAPRIAAIGAASMLACVFIATAGHELVNYWLGLVLLGVGWNFLFVGATVLLTQTYRAEERFRAQAVNDFSIFGIQALSSLSAGTVIFRSSWMILNLINIPVLLGILLALAWLSRYQARLSYPTVQAATPE